MFTQLQVKEMVMVGTNMVEITLFVDLAAHKDRKFKLRFSNRSGGDYGSMDTQCKNVLEGRTTLGESFGSWIK